MVCKNLMQFQNISVQSSPSAISVNIRKYIRIYLWNPVYTIEFVYANWYLKNYLYLKMYTTTGIALQIICNCPDRQYKTKCFANCCKCMINEIHTIFYTNLYLVHVRFVYQCNYVWNNIISLKCFAKRLLIICNVKEYFRLCF